MNFKVVHTDSFIYSMKNLLGIMVSTYYLTLLLFVICNLQSLYLFMNMKSSRKIPYKICCVFCHMFSPLYCQSATTSCLNYCMLLYSLTCMGTMHCRKLYFYISNTIRNSSCAGLVSHVLHV